MWGEDGEGISASKEWLLLCGWMLCCKNEARRAGGGCWLRAIWPQRRQNRKSGDTLLIHLATWQWPYVFIGPSHQWLLKRMCRLLSTNRDIIRLYILDPVHPSCTGRGGGESG